MVTYLVASHQIVQGLDCVLHLALSKPADCLHKGGALAVLGLLLHSSVHLLLWQVQVLGKLLQQPLLIKVTGAIAQNCLYLHDSNNSNLNRITHDCVQLTVRHVKIF